MLDRKVEKIVTPDGSHTLYDPFLDETYHSRRGAQTESEHIYIDKGLNEVLHDRAINVLEVGFGTGLNAILAYEWALSNKREVWYKTYEAFLLNGSVLSDIQFPVIENDEYRNVLMQMHEDKVMDHPLFKFQLIESTIESAEIEINHFDVVFFDAFAPSKQAEIWEPNVLEKMYALLNDGGRLVTYCAQGQFKRNLKSIGFKTEHPPGPLGKKEMTIAIK